MEREVEGEKWEGTEREWGKKVLRCVGKIRLNEGLRGGCEIRTEIPK